MKHGTCQTFVVKGEKFFVEKIKGISSGDIYYKVWIMHDFPRHDFFLGYFSTMKEVRKYAFV